VAKSKSGEFYSFDEVLRRLSIDENRLKRLVSEGEIRAFREGDQMRFKRTEIDSLSGRGGRTTAETSLTEISLEDESQPTVHVGRGRAETLSDDVLEPDVGRSGMRTAEISSQDTFIDTGDVGMSTEPIEFTEEESVEEVEEISDIGADRPVRRTQTTTVRRRVVAAEEPRTSPLLVAAMCLSVIVGIFAILLTLAISRGGPEGGLPKWFATTLGPDPNTPLDVPPPETE
jgi:excisionase family DNA binding protein